MDTLDPIYEKAASDNQVDPMLLRAIAMTESSNNPNAIGYDDNGNETAHGLMQLTPATAKALGVKNAFDPAQAIPAAASLVRQNLDMANGDTDKAILMYHGGTNQDNWGSKTQAYLGKVKNNVAKIVQQDLASNDPVFQHLSGNSAGQSASIQPAPGGDPVYDHLMGVKPATKTSSANKTTQPNQITDYLSPKTVVDVAAGPLEAGANLITGVGSTIAGGFRGLAKLASGGSVDDAAKAVQDTQQNYTYQPRTQTGQAHAEYNPVALAGKALSEVGGKAGDLELQFARLQGLSPEVAAGLATGLDVGTQFALPVGIAKGAKVLMPGRSAAAIDSADAARSISTDKAATAIQPLPTPQEARIPGALSTSAQGAPVGQPLNMPPLRPAAIATGEITPETRTTYAITPADAAERAQVLKRVGVEETRKSAVEADPLAASSDYQTTRVDSPAGRRMLAGFNAERNALETHAQGIVNDTGGTLGTDQSALYSRGNTILQPLDSLKEWYDNGIKKLYGQANERAQGQPVTLDETNKLLSTKSNFTGNSDTLALKNGVTDRMQELGMLDDKGNLTSSTVDQAENLRKYLNEQWSPKNSHIIGQLKDSLDTDVSKGAGEDIYQEARALRAKRAEMLDDPRGIANIMDSSGPSGINRKVDIEKIPTAITSMPINQFKHVINQLKSVPDELQPQAQAALAEIKAHFANQLHDIGSMTKGQWNAGGVNKFLKNNSERLGVLFGGDHAMLGKINDLRDAGNILSYNSAYPGAAAQAHNLLQRGAIAMGAGVGGSVGAAVGGGLGAAIGTPVGAGVGSKAADAIGLRTANKRFVKLSDLGKTK